MNAFNLLTRVLVAAIWLFAAYRLRNSAGGRQALSYLSGILTMIYAGCYLGGTLMGSRSSTDWGAPLVGFLAGGAVGLAAGIILGTMAAKHLWIYALLQIGVALVFLLMPPLA
jgi:integral membrane sensor domain MASE1